MSPSSLEWFSSFLQNRSQSVRVNSKVSEWRTPKSGIPQGMVLGPTLFLIFINDLPDHLKGEASIFADDTTVSTMGKNPIATCENLSSDLCLASTWATNWGMQFSAEKSEHLTIHARKGPVSPGNNGDRISMAGVLIPAVDSHRHLGLIINTHLTWTNILIRYTQHVPGRTAC